MNYRRANPSATPTAVEMAVELDRPWPRHTGFPSGQKNRQTTSLASGREGI